MEGKIRQFFKGMQNEGEKKLTEADQKIIAALKRGAKNRIWDRESIPEFLEQKREMVLFQVMINDKKKLIKEKDDVIF